MGGGCIFSGCTVIPNIKFGCLSIGIVSHLYMINVNVDPMSMTIIDVGVDVDDDDLR